MSDEVINTQAFVIQDQLRTISELRKENEALAKGIFEFDKGPWCYGHTKEATQRVYVESNTFKHDVRLYVDGDFESFEQKMVYAQSIAVMLNRFKLTSEQDTLKTDFDNANALLRQALVLLRGAAPNGYGVGSEQEAVIAAIKQHLGDV